MKQRLIVRLATRPYTRILGVVVAVAVVAMQIGCTSCRVAPSSTSTLRPRLPAGTRPDASSEVRLVCPTVGVSRVPATLAKRDHRVILSWKASAPGDSMHDAAIGYCVYRGLKSNDPSPELVNPIPFPDTSCTDDLVENDKKYYYVVRAISAKGITSITSNEAPATIPSGKQSHRSISVASAPLCRESVSVK